MQGKYFYGSLKNDKPRSLTVAPTVLEVLKESKKLGQEFPEGSGEG